MRRVFPMVLGFILILALAWALKNLWSRSVASSVLTDGIRTRATNDLRASAASANTSNSGRQRVNPYAVYRAEHTLRSNGRTVSYYVQTQNQDGHCVLHYKTDKNLTQAPQILDLDLEAPCVLLHRPEMPELIQPIYLKGSADFLALAIGGVDEQGCGRAVQRLHFSQQGITALERDPQALADAALQSASALCGHSDLSDKNSSPWKIFFNKPIKP